MNDNRDEIQRLRAMRAEAVSRNDFARADAIGADLARLEGAQGAGGTVDPITGLPAAAATAPGQVAVAPQPAPRREERPTPSRPAYEEQHSPSPRPIQQAPAQAAPQLQPGRRPAAPEPGQPAQSGEYRPAPSRPAYGGEGRGDRAPYAPEMHDGGHEGHEDGQREEKRRHPFGKPDEKKKNGEAQGRPAPQPAPRRAAPKSAPAVPTKGSRALTVVAAVAIAVSVGATVFSGMRVAESSAVIAKNEANSVNVVVTTRDVAAGETIAETDLETQAVPKAYCPADAATKVSDVAGRVSLTTQTAGNSISLSSIQASSSPAHITSAIEDGHVAIALSLDSSKSLSPLLRVGDRVNVMAVVSDGTTSSAETVCANVRIIALDSALSGSPEAGYSLVTLDVTEDQAAAIVANPNVTLTAIPQTTEGAGDAE